MRTHHTIALVLTTALLVIGSAMAMPAASADEDLPAAPRKTECGGLAPDEYYACQQGNWQPGASLATGPAYLDALSADQRARLSVWLERGIRFEGDTWDADDIDLAIEGLDAILHRFGGDWAKLKPLLGITANATLTYDDDTATCPGGHRVNCALPWEGRVHFNAGSFTLNEFLHENGHVVDWFLRREHGTAGQWWSSTGLLGVGWQARREESRSAHGPVAELQAVYDDSQHDAAYSQANMQEDFADSFVAWVLGPQPPEPYRPISPRRQRVLNAAFRIYAD